MKKFLLAVLVWLLIYACGGGGGSSTPVAQIPLPPRKPAFINVSSSNLAIFARWSSISDAKFYRLYYSAHSSLPLKNNPDVAKLKVYGNHSTVITTTPTRYYLTVTAVNDVGESNESSRKSVVTTNPPPSPPSLP